MDIKFRAYIKDLDGLDYDGVPHKGHFVYGNLIKGNSNDNIDAIVGNLIDINDEYVNVEWWQSIEKGSAEQSTGLKDIDDEEIYVGDIVSLDPDDPPFTVFFDDGKYQVNNGYIIYDLNETNMDCEIIGNVHENPELLEEQHE